MMLPCHVTKGDQSKPGARQPRPGPVIEPHHIHKALKNVNKAHAPNWDYTMLRVAVLGFLAFSAAGAVADKIEEPAYTPLGNVGQVELRLYAPSIQARTPLADSGQTNSGFQRLAGYIFGGNDSEMEIAMTAPRAAMRNFVRQPLDSLPGTPCS